MKNRDGIYNLTHKLAAQWGFEFAKERAEYVLNQRGWREPAAVIRSLLTPPSGTEG